MVRLRDLHKARHRLGGVQSNQGDRQVLPLRVAPAWLAGVPHDDAGVTLGAVVVIGGVEGADEDGDQPRVANLIELLLVEPLKPVRHERQLADGGELRHGQV